MIARSRNTRLLAAALCTCAAAIVLPAAHAVSSVRAWDYAVRVSGIPVSDISGRAIAAPFIGGFDLPRPQLVDMNGDGKADLFVQERTGQLIYFERAGDDWVWRSDRYQDLNVGEWYRFVDADKDGDPDLFSEMPNGYVRVWQNSGTRTAPRFVALGDTVRDVDGMAIAVDRQNILNAVDIDCNGKLDLFIGRVQGVVDRMEQEGNSPDGSPRFRFVEEKWQGIEVLGPEVGGGSLQRIDAVPRRGPSVAVDSSAALHGANTLTFADVSGHGVPDLFWGDFFEQGLLRFENVGTCAQPDLTGKPARFPRTSPVLTSGYNAPTFGDVDGDGIIDMVMGVIGGAFQPTRTSIENLYLLQQSPKDNWTVKTKRLVATIDVGTESAPVLADLNSDGLLDLIVGNKATPDDPNSGTVAWFENVGSATAPAFRERPLLPIRGEFNYAPTVVDLDGDGLNDIVVGTWRDRIQWYRNQGTRSAPQFKMADSVLVTITRGSNTTPTFGDLDGDGLLDLVIGEASGTLNVYRNSGTRTAPKFALISDNFQSIKVVRRSAPVLVDMDGDGKLDLLIGSDDGELQLWRAVGAAGQISFERDVSFTVKSYPNATPAVGDLRRSGRLDLIVGVQAGGLRWFENMVGR